MADFCPKCQGNVNPRSEYTSIGERLVCPICGTTLCFVPDGTTLRGQPPTAEAGESTEGKTFRESGQGSATHR